MGDPLSFLRWASRKIPGPTGLVLAGTVVFAAAAVVLGWTRQYGLATTAAVATLIIVFGVVASAIAALPKGTWTWLGTLLAWALALLFIVVLGFFVTSAFLGIPERGAELVGTVFQSTKIISNITQDTKPVVVKENTTVRFDELPPEMRQPANGSNVYEQARIIATRPKLIVRGLLEFSEARGPKVISASSIELEGGTIITNGQDVTIETNNFASDNGEIKGLANPGARAAAGQPGKDAKTITLIVYNVITGTLGVDLRGQSGAIGGNGTNGAVGPQGPQGQGGSDHMFDCARGGGPGGKGGPGGRGGDGLPGTSGGNGGHLLVEARNLEAARRSISTSKEDYGGGGGGMGGSPGHGGPGGPGGPGGGGTTYCRGGANGPQGDTGADGTPGANSAPGQNGGVSFRQI